MIQFMPNIWSMIMIFNLINFMNMYMSIYFMNNNKNFN